MESNEEAIMTIEAKTLMNFEELESLVDYMEHGGYSNSAANDEIRKLLDHIEVLTELYNNQLGEALDWLAYYTQKEAGHDVEKPTTGFPEGVH